MWTGRHAVFRDFLILLAFVCFLAAMWPVNANNRTSDADNQGLKPPGNVIVEVRWDANSDSDIDLWCQGPGDVPVGYSNKSGIIFNLVRDDLGRSGDPNSMNYEVQYARGRWPGEYVVNLHAYRIHDQKLPVEADVTITTRDREDNTRQILKSHVSLEYEGQETTVFRFMLDQDGNLVPDSVNRIHKALRSGAK